MIDCNGKRILIGWAEWELLYVFAALTLSKKDRIAAYADIAHMTGRTIKQVQHKCFDVAYQRQEAELARQRKSPRQVTWAKAPPQPSTIKPATPAQMMVGRASRSAMTGVR